jgi:hypothetical protein
LAFFFFLSFTYFIFFFLAFIVIFMCNGEFKVTIVK